MLGQGARRLPKRSPCRWYVRELLQTSAGHERAEGEDLPVYLGRQAEADYLD